ncbi:MAG: 2-oxoacid:acceptor oxidoreductase family protein [Alphaproteobacteria bacterium]|jgi:2-oxoglutarate ferredoxin oxidoreductase subunit gamma|nr:2-oxoacid:acceptor oxidoreductase family protein [Alphaproteobacteria bacterium]MDP6515278.1 2-oxoacid:acceptor oxidoreductase family protein [Alphaproteobacteria bacterium]
MDTTEIRLCGIGGQGLILGARVLAKALVSEGRKVAQSQSYEPTSRGELSRADLLVGDEAPDYPLATALDLALILDQAAAGACDGLLKPSAMVLADSEKVPAPPQGAFTTYSYPFAAAAAELGTTRAANMAALGALVALSGICAPESLIGAIGAIGSRSHLARNTDAVHAGLRMVRDASPVPDPAKPRPGS